MCLQSLADETLARFPDRIDSRLCSLCARSSGLSTWGRFVKMRPLLNIARLLILGSLAARAAGAQDLVKSADLPQANWILDNAPRKNLLPCYIQLSSKLHLDLLFRYTAGFLIECRLGVALPPGTRLVALLRITPRLGAPVLMMEHFDLPQARQQDPAGLFAAPFQSQASMSGGFAVGPGEYSVELVLADLNGHTCRKRKVLKPGEERGARNVPFAIKPGAVAPLMTMRWNGALASNGLRLTVFLNAYGPNGSTYLRAFERAYVMQSLFTLLTQIPCKSIKLVAFELDRQQEVFRQEPFDAGGFVQLQNAMERISFASISYQALQKGTWRRFLVDLVKTESASDEPPDVIIFLGAWGSHEWEKLPREEASKIEIANAHVSYFELFPLVGGAPDGVERLTKDLHGSVYAIRSPETLAQAIKKTLSRTAAPSN